MALVRTLEKEGDSIMKTTAQRYIDQGYELGLEQARQEMQLEIQKAKQEAQKVRQELQAKERMGLLSSIELGLELKFGKEGLPLFNEVQQIQEMSLRIIFARRSSLSAT